MADEELHEFQLNGKQLVFAFMTLTVAAVVVFLLGIMVGRGLKPVASAELATATDASGLDPTAPTQTAPTQAARTQTVTPRSGESPISAQETLTYAERLDSKTPAPEDLRASVDPTVPTPVREPIPDTPPPTRSPTSTAGPAPAASAAASPAADPALAEPAGNGYVVQVMAVNTRKEADSIAKRLVSKGYPTFVTTNTTGTKNVSYRVRVGKFNDRREAETIASRLQKEEQFKPWITR
jgi:cell division septation protein DedD